MTEILLTLESAIDNVTADLVFTEVRDRQRGNSSRRSEFRRSTSNLYCNWSPSGTYEVSKRHTVSAATCKILEGATSSATNNQPGTSTNQFITNISLVKMCLRQL